MLTTDTPHGPLVIVPDISEYQRGTDLGALQDAGVTCLVHRACDPARNGAWRQTSDAAKVAREVDPMFGPVALEALARGFNMLGTYAFTRPTYGTPAGEMGRILATIERTLDGRTIPYMFDVEVSAGDSWPSPAVATRWLEDACKFTEDRWQRPAFFYNAQWFYGSHLVASDYLAAHMTVVAAYRNHAPDDDGFTDPATFGAWAFQSPGLLAAATPAPWKSIGEGPLGVGPNVIAWQITAGALMPGIPGRSDVNLFAPAALARLVGHQLATPTPSPTPSPAPAPITITTGGPDMSVQIQVAGDAAVYVTDGITASHLKTEEAQAGMVAAGIVDATVHEVTRDVLAALILVSDPPPYPADYAGVRTTAADFRPAKGDHVVTVAGAPSRAAVLSAMTTAGAVVADALGAV